MSVRVKTLGLPIPEPLERVADSLWLVHGGTQASGVYFLIDEGEVVRIGQSINVASRVSSQGPFDYAYYLAVDEEWMDEVESRWILDIRPPRNGEFKGGAPATPLSEDALDNPVWLRFRRTRKAAGLAWSRHDTKAERIACEWAWDCPAVMWEIVSNPVLHREIYLALHGEREAGTW